MSYQTYNRNAKSLVYFGDAGADALFQSDSDLKFDDSSNKLIIPSNGYIGSVGNDAAIQIDANGNVTLATGVTIQGDLTVNGDTTTVSTTNLAIQDSIIELSNGYTGSTPTNDGGFVVERGTLANAAFFWDESADRFSLGLTSNTANDTSITLSSTGTLVANIVGSVTGNVTGDVTGDLTGNADTATTATTATTANNLAGSFITGLTDLGNQIDGTNDLLLVYDASATGYKSISRDDLVTGLGTMSSFTIAGDTGSDSITQGNTLTVAGGAGLTSSVASDTVTVAVGAGTGITVNANDITVNYDDSTIGVSGNDLFVKDGGITFAKLAGTFIQTSSEISVSFQDNDESLLTAAAIEDRILSKGYSTTTGTVTSVGGTGSVNGITLTGTVTSAGNLTLGGTLSNVAVSNMAASAIQTGTEVGATGGSIVDDDDSLLTAAAIINFVEGKGYSTTDGTVTSVATAGSVNGITLTGGTITSTGTITLGGTLSNIANSQLTNSAITIAGVSTSLGGSITANTIAGAIGAGIITNAQLVNDSVSFGGVSLDLGQSDATPAFNLTNATNYKFGSLTRVINSSAITSDSTVSNDISLVDSTSGAVTMTLPTPANGKFYTIKKVDSSANAVIVDAGTGSATLDGGANFTLYHQYETVSCVCDGTNWHIV